MKEHSIEDFIGIFDGYFGNDLCDRYISHFNELEKNNLVWPRENDSHYRSDAATCLITHGFQLTVPIPYIVKEFNEIYWSQCAPLYSKKYSILNVSAPHIIIDAKLQKTCEGEGYHIWHSENGGDHLGWNRLLSFMLYLNDDYEAGETEFLYQKRRIQPQKDRLLVWPAQFTHTHRGNMVLKGTKYVLTGWVEWAHHS